MSWMALARGAAWCGLCLVLATGCGSSDSSSGTGGSGGSPGGGGDGGAGGGIPDSCEEAVALAASTCVVEVSGAWADCYVETGGPCEDDDPAIEAAMEVLGQVVDAACADDEFGSLTVQALTERAQVSCESEALSLQSRSYGGPQGAAWTSADGDGQSCLLAAHESAIAFFEDATAAYNQCLAAGDCDPDTLETTLMSLQDTATADIDAACTDLASLIAVSTDVYLDRAKYQADCVVATTHTETPGTELSCGPTRAPDDLPRGEYFQVILDSEEWGTLCGDGSEWAFQVRLPPEGEPLENVIVGMQDGGVCVLDDCVSRNPDLFESLTDVAPDSGIFSNDPESNPFGNWTKVYLPYCNQDVFVGGGAIQQINENFSVARYGAVNVRAAMQYVRDLIWRLKDAEDGDGYRPDQVTAMFGGWSAGGFGTLYNYHFVLDDLQWPSTTAFPDAALALNSGELAIIPTIGSFAIGAWQAEAFLPPYCFSNECAVGPVMYEASEPRLKAVPNQQFMILTNQNDDVQVGTTGFASNADWINEERTTVCDTRDLNGIHYYLTTFTQSIHVVSLDDALYEGSVDGETMVDWLYGGAVTGPDNVVDRMEEGDFVMDIPGVDPFPCQVAP